MPPGPDSGSPPAGGFLVDAHVHLHPVFDEAVFLAAAGANFRRAAGALGISARAPGVLLLAEPADRRRFAPLRAELVGGESFGLSWSGTAEDLSLVGRRPGEPPLALIAGRQIVSGEGLEVLALATAAEIPDGLALAEAVARAREAGALPVLPWGFGKWRGRRGDLVAALLGAAEPGSLYLGDNGGRPRLAPEPVLFERARSRGLAVLRGSDPLPFAREATRAGSFGFFAVGALDLERPAETLRRTLRAGGELRSFGSGRRLLPFAHSQLTMQLRRLRPARGAGGAG